MRENRYQLSDPVTYGKEWNLIWKSNVFFGSDKGCYFVAAAVPLVLITFNIFTV